MNTSLPPEDASTRALISCGSAKTDTPGLAKALYTSGYFQKKRQLASYFANEWWILSAKHHVVAPNQLLEPYEKSLPKASAVEVRGWAETTKQQLAWMDWAQTDHLLLFLGKTYREPIMDFLESLDVEIHVPFDQHGGIGDQNGWMKQEIDRLTPCISDSQKTLDSL